MSSADLFQLGTGLETGAHAEDTHSLSADRSVFDETRDDHFIRRDGRVFAGTHLILEVVNGHGLDDEARIQTAFRDQAPMRKTLTAFRLTEACSMKHAMITSFAAMAAFLRARI